MEEIVKKGISAFGKLSRKEKCKHFCVWEAILLFLLFLFVFNQKIEKKQLIEENGNQFEKAEVVEIVSENRNEDGSQQGTQKIKVRLKSGEFKGEVVEATNIDSYLYGADCKVGTSVVVQISEYNGKISASVYNYNRTMDIGFRTGRRYLFEELCFEVRFLKRNRKNIWRYLSYGTITIR